LGEKRGTLPEKKTRGGCGSANGFCFLKTNHERRRTTKKGGESEDAGHMWGGESFHACSEGMKTKNT